MLNAGQRPALPLSAALFRDGLLSAMFLAVAKTAREVVKTQYRHCEPLGRGRAVITTDVPGCRETVENGVNGFVVPKWDEKALAEAMFTFIEQPELIEKMGLESYRIAQDKFDVAKVNQRLLNMLGL